MQYKIIIEPTAENDLWCIFNYIKDDDSQNQARKFIKKLQKAINSLSLMPNRCRNMRKCQVSPHCSTFSKAAAYHDSV